MNTSKIAVYIRVSTLEQANNWFWKDLQLTRIKKLIDYKYDSWEEEFIFDENLVYKDLWISGAKEDKERPGLAQLMRDIEKWKIKKVVIWRLDRLARKTKFMLEMVEFFDRYNIDFISTDENIDTKTPTWKFFLTILWAIWEMERSLIAEKTFLWKIEQAKKWQYPFGKTKFWYKKDAKTKKLVVVKEEAKIIKKIFDLYVNESKSLNQISQIMTDSKMMNKCDWRRIWKIIWEEVYTWNLWINTHKNEVDKHWKKVRIEKPKEEHILIKVEPIIAENIFKKAQKKLTENKFIFNNKNKAIENHLFAWLVQCKECWSNYKAYVHTKNGNRNIYYRCSKTTWARWGKVTKDYCKNSQLSESILLKKVLADINEIIKNPKNIEKQYLKQSNATKNIEKYKQEIEILKEKIDSQYETIDKLYDRFDVENDKKITEIIEKKIAWAKNTIKNLQNRIEELEDYIKAEKKNNENKEILYNFAKNLKDLKLKELERDELKDYLRKLINKIYVSKDKIEVIYVISKDDINSDKNSKNQDKEKTTNSCCVSNVTGESNMVELMGFEPMS